MIVSGVAFQPVDQISTSVLAAVCVAEAVGDDANSEWIGVLCFELCELCELFEMFELL